MLLCSHHHRLLHEGGYTITVHDRGDLVFRDARGADIDEHGRPTVPHWAQPLLPKAQDELLPLWSGDKLDLDYAVSVLLDARTYRTNLGLSAAPAAA